MGLDKRKVLILDKVISSGADSVKKISALDARRIFEIMMDQGMKMSDMRDILDLQDAVKAGDLLTFLTRRDPFVRKEEKTYAGAGSTDNKVFGGIKENH